MKRTLKLENYLESAKKRQKLMLPTISLTEIESALFRHLKCVAKYCECNCVMRVAGGWVRDKLLGKESDDIDIAFDTITGNEFAECLQKYEKETADSPTAFRLGNIALIKANPDQSKHLETANVHIKTGDLTIDIDFVHLRAEDYVTESRIPEIKIGTPKEDALRRDLTINALFYNINTGEIEDFTNDNLGTHDLLENIIRTPLEPRQTFLDDPLRILRSVRFACRLGFKVVDELKEAVKHEDVREALDLKVSRERISKELNQMLSGPDPLRALTMLWDFGLFSVIFGVTPNTLAPPADTPENCPPPISKKFTQAAARKFLLDRAVHYSLSSDFFDKEFSGVSSLPETYAWAQNLVSSQEPKMLELPPWSSPCPTSFLYSLILLPSIGERVLGGSKQTLKPVPLHDSILRNYLHATKKLLEDVDSFFKAVILIVDCCRSLEEGGEVARSTVGLAVRAAKATRQCPDRWLEAVMMARIYNDVVLTPQGNGVNAESFDQFVKDVIRLELTDASMMKPLFDGKTLCKVIGIKPGPGIGVVVEKITRWQLDNPEGDKDVCVAQMQAFCRTEEYEELVFQKKRESMSRRDPPKKKQKS